MHANDSVRSNESENSRSSARTPTGRAATPLPALLALQGSAGNAAVVQMLRRAGHPWAQEEHGHSAGCGHQQTEQPVQRSTVPDVLRSTGRPLDDDTRTEMETRLGADFSDVRIHDDSAARASAFELGARAYTSGSDVVLGEGGADRHTLAHELTHVIQQRRGPVAGSDTGHGLRVSDPSDRFEREAEATARRVMSGPVSEHQHTNGSASDSASHNHGHVVQRLIEFEPNADDGGFELQLTSERPAWEGNAKNMADAISAANAANAAAQRQALSHIIPFERIQRDLAKHANDLFDNRGTTRLQGVIAAFEANCDALFTIGSPEHTTMVQRRNAVINALAHPLTRTQRDLTEAALENLLSALNSSTQNLRSGNASLNSSLGASIDADFLPGTSRHTGPVFTEGRTPPPNAVPLPNPGMVQGTHSVTNLEYVRLTPQHESHVFAYSTASRSSLNFNINGLAGVLHPALQNGQHMSSTQAPTAVRIPPYPVLVMDPNGNRAPLLFIH
ncbi:eCIS core domain-containing protein [Streptomyces mangrovi]|uniref:eCIS core domain-containing protein n=1 Tax=Streptomyces mangrovi TaxID=1206892 RepID=UPI00399C75F2